MQRSCLGSLLKKTSNTTMDEHDGIYGNRSFLGVEKKLQRPKHLYAHELLLHECKAATEFHSKDVETLEAGV